MRYLLLCSFLLIHCSTSIVIDDSEFSSDLSSQNERIVDDENVFVDCERGEICSIKEVFHLSAPETALDMVFVLDVSPSMKKNLEKLGQKMNSILSYISEFDWQMAFTTADHGDHIKTTRGGEVIISNEDWRNYDGEQPYFGQFMNLEYRGQIINETILKKENNFHRDIFYDTLTMEGGPSLPPFSQRGHEQPLRVLKSVFERYEDEPFPRKKGITMAIVISNEEERVEDSDQATTAEEVQAAHNAAYPGKKFYGFGIIVDSESCYKQQKGGIRRRVAEYGRRLARLAEVTQGRNISICSADYGPALQGISRLVRTKALNNVYLKTALPQESSVQVSIQPAQSVEWRVEGRYIVFDSPLKTGTQVEVVYTPINQNF